MQEQAEERVSARFEKAMMDEIDHHVKKHGIANRSEFLRMAARAMLDARQLENTITVDVSPLLREFIDVMVDRGYYRSQSHAVQSALDEFFTEERVRGAHRAARCMEITTGKKVEAEVERNTQRQMVKP